LTVFNKIENAQEYHKFTNTENILLHSNFLNSDKQEIIMKIYDLYDKKSNRNIKKSNVISTNILSASHDLSFNNINMSLHSPEYTIQLIGRNNRWGDINESCNINIINNLLTSEKDVVNA